MKNKDIVYVEPDDYFPKEIRDKLFPENKEDNKEEQNKSENQPENQPTPDDQNKTPSETP